MAVPEQRAASHDLEESRLTSLCHDLRQYVVAGLLIADADDEPSAAQARYRLASLRAVLEQLRTLLDAETDGAAPGRRRIAVSELVGGCVEMARLTGAEVVASLAPGVASVGDPALLRRAVMNLLDNAARAVGEHGRVQVHVRRAEDRSVIEVIDDGLGFGRTPRGSGYGMLVVARAVDACHGDLEILSGSGGGTTVRMVLPGDGGDR